MKKNTHNGLRRVTEWARPDEQGAFSETAPTYGHYCVEEMHRLQDKGRKAEVVTLVQGPWLSVAVFAK